MTQKKPDAQTQLHRLASRNVVDECVNRERALMALEKG
jgi:hypothetical protein